MSFNVLLLLVEVGFLCLKEKNYLKPTQEDVALRYALLMVYN